MNSDKKFVYGFAANDILYLVSSEKNALLACNLDGTEKSGYGALSRLEIYMGTTFGYGEGWIYYTGNDGNIHKVSENGNKDTILRVVSESRDKESENYRNMYTVEMKGQKMRYFETNMGSG